MAVAYKQYTVDDADQVVYKVPFPIDDNLSAFVNGELVNLDGEFSLGPEPDEVTFIDDLLDIGDTVEFRRL